jgi:hypothetical protein
MKTIFSGVIFIGYYVLIPPAVMMKSVLIEQATTIPEYYLFTMGRDLNS